MVNEKNGERLFVALDPPDEVQAAASNWGQEAALTGEGMRPLDAGRVHLTLAFLGYRDPREAGPIAEVMDRVARPVADLALGAPLWLPKRRPRALAIAINRESSTLEDLRSELVAGLRVAVGWKPEDRAFLPHLTAVRMGRGFRSSRADLPPTPPIRFATESLTLYRSILTPEGARYEALAVVEP